MCNPRKPSSCSDLQELNRIQNQPDLQSLLSKQLGPEYLSTRPGAGGSKLTYVEGWRIIALANEVFGYDGWSSETKTIEVDFVDQSPDGRFSVGVSAVVKITLRDGTCREDVGYGKLENSRSKADALDKCKKEAVTDALKRTMRTFGNLLGNCLYDKSYLNNIKTMQAQKEKFLPSKLYRPDFVNNRTTTTTTGTESKPCQNQSSSEEKKEVPKPKLPMTVLTKQTTPRAITAPITKPTVYKSNQQVTKVEPKFDPSKLPQPKIPEKRKFLQEEEEEEEEEQEKENANRSAEENVQEEPEESTEDLMPFPATLSDKYFDFDESELAELDNVESSEIFGVQSGQGCSGDESGLITEASALLDDESTTLVNNNPSRSIYQPQDTSTKRHKIGHDESISRPLATKTTTLNTNSSVRFNTVSSVHHTPIKLPLKTGNNLLDKSARSNPNTHIKYNNNNKVIQAGQLPNIKSSVIRYPSTTNNGPILNKYV